MSRLLPVTKEQAEKLLSHVKFEKYIVGTEMTQMEGNLQHEFTSLKEVEAFLHMDHVHSMEEVKVIGDKSIVVGYVDLNRLTTWVAEEYADQELAAAIGAEVEKGTCYMDRVGPVKQLLQQRIAQCETLLAPADGKK